MKNPFARPTVEVRTAGQARLIRTLLSIRIVVLLLFLGIIMFFGNWGTLQIVLGALVVIGATLYQWVFLPRWYKTHRISPLSWLLGNRG